MTKSNTKKSKPTTLRITQQDTSPLNDYLPFNDNQNSKEYIWVKFQIYLNQKIYQISDHLKFDIRHMIALLV